MKIRLYNGASADGHSRRATPNLQGGIKLGSSLQEMPARTGRQLNGERSNLNAGDDASRPREHSVAISDPSNEACLIKPDKNPFWTSRGRHARIVYQA
jgi:hypothetical protein